MLHTNLLMEQGIFKSYSVLKRSFSTQEFFCRMQSPNRGQIFGKHLWMHHAATTNNFADNIWLFAKKTFFFKVRPSILFLDVN